jgi:hypothetical protein
MQATIQSVGIDINNNLETLIQRKQQFSLSCVESYTTEYSINLISITNIKDNHDVHCRFTLKMVDQPKVVIEGTQVNLEYVINRILHKASRAAERLVFKA